MGPERDQALVSVMGKFTTRSLEAFFLFKHPNGIESMNEVKSIKLAFLLLFSPNFRPHDLSAAKICDKLGILEKP